MKCTKCGNSLEDSAKFCTKCGTAITSSDGYLQNETPYSESTTQQLSFENPTVQQPQYETIKTSPTQSTESVIQQAQNYATPYQSAPPTPKSSTKSIAVMALIIMLFVAVGLIISNLYATNLRLENEKKYYQNQVEEYENENAIDKTVDAISSWFDYIY
ncbi:MAG: zinc ribbon domain-containing protein [Lachnospiraceae bacterium]|nr:zinc ribbon domain-containing protein [Lachnospiraceae bacterium]MBD5506200.1 zinc ribbon domain-containing protein [Lachnospiraceae bacterium]